MRFFGDEEGHSWEEYGPEIYAGKRKQKWGVYILTEEIGRECLYALGAGGGCSQQTIKQEAKAVLTY